jgi:methionine-rich copper-binding protein CopC
MRMKQALTSRRVLRLFLLALVAFLCFAHAILLDSTPSLNQTLRGDHFTILLHYNSRVDGARSQLTLISVDGAKRITLEKQTEPDKLQAQATELKPGSYRLVWQVLASDGHLTRGQIPFKVE